MNSCIAAYFSVPAYLNPVGVAMVFYIRTFMLQLASGSGDKFPPGVFQVITFQRLHLCFHAGKNWLSLLANAALW